MTKTKAQLRAEAVERLKNSVGARLKPDAAVIAIVGGRVGLSDWSLECDKLIDLLTDDCGPCYACSRLAELVAENSQLRARVDELNRNGRKVAQDMDNGENVHMCPNDSREKLEADIRKYRNEHCETSGRVTEWLDRQAAITEREIFDEMPHVRDRLAEQDSAIAEYAEKNAELTEQLESAHAKNRSLKAHIAKMQEGRHGWHVKYHELEKKNAELQAKVEELEVEVDAYRGKYEDMEFIVSIDEAMKFTTDPPGYVKKALADLREDVAERDDVIAVLKAENAELQSRHCEWSEPDSLGDGCMLRKDKRVDELTAERDELRAAYDEMTAIAAQLCRACGFSMVDTSGEVVS